MSPTLPSLPVVEALPRLKTALATGAAVLAAPPGSGKTTVVPLALLDDPSLSGGKKIVMLQPRRVAARAAARRLAHLLGEPIGQTVGYQVRFERRVSARTRIEVVTEGVLARRLQADPELPDTGLLIFDEFHERSLDADLGLALALDVRDTLRPDLKLLVMSATLDIQRVSQLLGNAPVVQSDGQLFPVDVRYRPARADLGHADAMIHAVVVALQETEGDVLGFLPGGREIRTAQAKLQQRLPSVAVCPLYGELSALEQDAALSPDPQGRRKVILSTNLAQTSLTVEGVRTVVDGGFVRVSRFDVGAGADRLETQRVSRASADQRAGRAGRLGPGVAYRLWSVEQHSGLPAHDTPDIVAVDLSRFVLELAAWGVGDPSALRLLDAPPDAAWRRAREALIWAGALYRDGQISPHGRAVVRLPTSPRRGHMLIEARRLGLGSAAAWVAAVLDERDAGDADLVRRVEAAVSGRGDAALCRRVADSAAQLARLIDVVPARRIEDESVARIVAAGFPERLARRRSERRGNGQVAFLCADGSEAQLPESEELARAEWLAVADWSLQSAGGVATRRIRQAVEIGEATVRADRSTQVHADDVVQWDARTEAVLAERRESLGAIVLSRQPLMTTSGVAVEAALLEGIRQIKLGCLPWTQDSRQWQARVLSLRQWRPQEGWPDVSDSALTETLDHWLARYLPGMTRRDHLQRLDLMAALQGMLDYTLQQALARLAPTHLTVPTGSRLRLEYRPPEPPVLAVKLQELFGCRQTPSVNDGGVPVVLHLLSPAQRPVAVTQDLAGFWQAGYHDVRKDMRGRYPRHPWPDDPASAEPTRRAKPRGS